MALRPMPPRPRAGAPRLRHGLRTALSAHVSNGLSAALGLLLISAGVHAALGAPAAAAASVGVLVCIPPDQPAPRHGKLLRLLPAALLGWPLFWAAYALHGNAWLLGLLLVPATFVAFLAGAWGKRGLPIVVSVMFALVFAMAVPRHEAADAALRGALHFGLGAGLYLLWATAANALLNRCYRVQMLAGVLFTLAELMRLQASRFVPAPGAAPTLEALLRRQAALADQLQTVRDLVLESPRTPRRQRQAGLLLHVLELRDHLLACELDLEGLLAHPGHAPVLAGLRAMLLGAAADVEALADALLTGRAPAASETRRQ
uniref:FUSC family membrane protein n=1 Tax=uncultured Azohydromonas sp. TaxID=487342 RepID=UPI002639C7F0